LVNFESGAFLGRNILFFVRSLRLLETHFHWKTEDRKMAAQTWQIQVGQKLSKQYSIESLMAKFEKGAITDQTLCTEDNGASFVAVSTILKQPRFQKVRGQKRLQPSPSQPEVSDALVQMPAPERAVGGDARHVLAGLYASAAAAEQADDDHAALDAFTLPAASVNTKFTRPDDPRFYEPSSVAQAAANALAETQKRDEIKRHDRQDRATAQPEPASRPFAATDLAGQVDEPPPRNWKSVAMTAVVTAVGMSVIAVLIQWLGSTQGPPTYADLTGGAVALSDFDNNEEVTLESLHARTQILGVQVGRITRALLKQQDTDVEDVALPDLPSEPVLPLFPFQQRLLSTTEETQVSENRDRYSVLVKEKGPDGRKLDEATITAYVAYLQPVVNAVDSNGPTRAAALHELSEWVKLVYLLQLGRLHATVPGRHQQAVSELLALSNDGLAQLYPELRSGDMRFVDVFDRSESAEQSRLILIRYWYYRAVARKTADSWLDEVLGIVDESQHAAVRASIAEVDGIEGS
jgi:hypothetical protein